MQYMISVHFDESRPEPDQAFIEQAYKDVDVVNNELKDAGAWVFAGGLVPSKSAKTLRVIDGEVVTTDGPFAETKEQLGGFWVIEAPNLDKALEWAERGARACREIVEVRPFQPDPTE